MVKGPGVVTVAQVIAMVPVQSLVRELLHATGTANPPPPIKYLTILFVNYTSIKLRKKSVDFKQMNLL